VRLELCEVVKHYRSEAETVRAVDDVSLAVEPGELVAIYGPSGSGKTTLLLIAGAMLPPDSGEVVAGGRVVSELSEAEAAIFRRDNVGFVFQSFHLTNSATVTDNAAIKMLLAGMSPAEARRHAEPWLDRLGLGDRLAAVPSQLSAGQRQRVAIARALANEPKLLLADEPTGSLDAERGRDVLALIRELARERGLPAIIVTHDPQAMEFADRALVLRDGQLTTAPASRRPAVGAGQG
jgi:putative ABC transport system ATP-binding protein